METWGGKEFAEQKGNRSQSGIWIPKSEIKETDMRVWARFGGHHI